MRATRLFSLVCFAAWASIGTARGATVDGHEWPPDPGRYAPPGTQVAPSLKIGDTLGQDNAEAAKDLLPAEILRHYKEGQYRNPIVSWPEGLMHFDKSFEEATGENRGKYGVQAETGTIVEKATGKPPEYVYGLPFPGIQPNDPDAGLKAVWNQFYAWWINGNGYFHTLLVWASPSGVDRQAAIDVRYQFFSGQPPKYRVPNPQNFEVLSLNRVLNPTDLQGTTSLGHRFRDPGKHDATWAYVPAMRRVRAVSPANRSDGFLGSDLSQDDAQFFDGKPEDFVWKTVGSREGLRIVDPASVRGDGGALAYVPQTGGFRSTWARYVPAAGYLATEQKAFTWAPVSAALAKRKFWVVEAVPRDKYYLYGKIELWIDAETWQGAWNRKFSWKGELLDTYQVSSYLNHPTSRPGDADVEWLWSSQHAWNCAENVGLNRATLTGLRLSQDAPLDRRVKHNVEQIFDVNALMRTGK
jgi:hypothetical protein